MQIAPDRQEQPTEINSESDFSPVLLQEIELGQPLPTLFAFDSQKKRIYKRARCLIRLHTLPLGLVDLVFVEQELSPDKYVAQIWQLLGQQINTHLQEDGLPLVENLGVAGLPTLNTPRCCEKRVSLMAQAPFVSVVVPTHNRPDRIQSCLRTLLALNYPNYEIVVVDNAPENQATAQIIQEAYANMPQIRYIREDRVGGSRARNCGILAARGEIVVFADDDIVVDPYWLAEIVKAFDATDNVACVTGLLLPLELETPAQIWIEEFGGFSKGFKRRLFDMKKDHPQMPLHPYAAGQFGTGASMAFTAAFLRRVGGFDPALGPGTPACGGEDLALFFEAVVRGYTLVYEPAAIAYHPHHREYASLCKQISSYGVGLVAYLLRSILHRPRLLPDFIRKIPYGIYFTLGSHSSKNSKKSSNYPKELTKLEIYGMFYGPFAYIRSRWKVRHVRGPLSTDKPQVALPVEKESSYS